jgi:hypothetical protein
MKSKWMLLIAMILLLSVGMVVAGCGGGDDDDDDDDDTVPADDDDDATPGDDDDDDTTPGDDDDDTTPGDDDDDDDDDTTPGDVVFTPVYDETRCALPDPEGLGGNTIGGGPATTDITVYVYDDYTCAAIAGADVNGETTDSDGMAVVTASKGETLVVANAAGHWSWAYQADAAVMYFRLRGDLGGAVTDSATGNFMDGASVLDIENHFDGINAVLNAKVFIGAVLPGIARSTLLSLNEDALITASTFPMSYETFGFDDAGASFSLAVETIDLPTNVYLPDLDLSAVIIGYGIEASGVNEAYKVPIDAGATAHPIEGFAASIDIGEVVTLPTLTSIIIDLIGGGDIMETILGLVEPIINDGLSFEYQGVDPDWAGTGAPDIDVAAITGTTIDLDIDAGSGYDFLNILIGEVGNRALWPMGITLGDATTFDAAPVDDGDYALISAKTNLLAILDGSTTDPIELSLAAAYADDLDDFGGAVAFDNTSFLPVFDSDNTEYTAGGVINWQLSAKADVDAYIVAVLPDGYEMGIAVLPGTVSTFDASTNFDYPANVDDDVIVIIGMDLPEQTDINNFDPTTIAYQNAKALNLWTNYPIDELLEGLFPTF